MLRPIVATNVCQIHNGFNNIKIFGTVFVTAQLTYNCNSIFNTTHYHYVISSKQPYKFSQLFYKFTNTDHTIKAYAIKIQFIGMNNKSNTVI